jgi:hypothetical protein
MALDCPHFVGHEKSLPTPRQQHRDKQHGEFVGGYAELRAWRAQLREGD